MASYRSADIIQAVTDADILNDVYRFLTDPDDVAANRLLVRYEDSGGNSQSATFDNAAAQTQDGIVDRQERLQHLRTAADVEAWANTRLATLAFPPRYLEMRLKTDRLLPGDTLSRVHRREVRPLRAVPGASRHAGPHQRPVPRDVLAPGRHHPRCVDRGHGAHLGERERVTLRRSRCQASGFRDDAVDGLAPGQTAGTGLGVPHVSVWV